MAIGPHNHRHRTHAEALNNAYFWGKPHNLGSFFCNSANDVSRPFSVIPPVVVAQTLPYGADFLYYLAVHSWNSLNLYLWFEFFASARIWTNLVAIFSDLPISWYLHFGDAIRSWYGPFSGFTLKFQMHRAKNYHVQSAWSRSWRHCKDSCDIFPGGYVGLVVHVCLFGCIGRNVWQARSSDQT